MLTSEPKRAFTCRAEQRLLTECCGRSERLPNANSSAKTAVPKLCIFSPLCTTEQPSTVFMPGRVRLLGDTLFIRIITAVLHYLFQVEVVCFQYCPVEDRKVYSMIIVSIGEEQRSLQEATPTWINEQVNRRRADGQPICARVSIQQGGLNLSLATPNCSSTQGGGRRPPNPNEKELCALWADRGLNDPHFSGGNLVAFLAQLRRLFA